MFLGSFAGGLIDGYEGARRANQEAERAEAAKRDAEFREIERARLKKQWEDSDKATEFFQEDAKKKLSEFDRPQEDAMLKLRNANGFGLVPKDVLDSMKSDDMQSATTPAEKPAPSAPVADSPAVPMDKPAPQPVAQPTAQPMAQPASQPVAVQPTAPTQSTPMDAFSLRKEELKSIAQMAILQKDPKTYYAAQEDLRKLRTTSDAAAIENGIMNMSDYEYKYLAQQVTADKRNGYSLEVGEKGYATLKAGPVEVQLSRPEVAAYFAAKHRLAAGDPTAIADIAKIDDRLAAKAAADFKQAHEALTSNNTAAHYGVQDKIAQGNANRMAADSSDRAADRRERAADRADKPNQEYLITLRNIQGEAKAAEKGVVDAIGKASERTNEVDKDPGVIAAKAYAKKVDQQSKSFGAVSWVKSSGKYGVGPEAYIRDIVSSKPQNEKELASSINRVQSIAGPEYASLVMDGFMQTDAGKALQKPPGAPGSAPGSASTSSTGEPIKQSPGGRQITHQEQQFADAVSKQGWQYYTNQYGAWNDVAYRRPTKDGGWEIMKRNDLAKQLNIEF